MFILTQFFLVFSQEITWTNYSFAFPQYVPLIAEKTVFSRTFEEFGQIFNISIDYDGNVEGSICNFEYQQLLFKIRPQNLKVLVSEMQQVDIDLLRTEDIEQGFQEKIISYATFNRNLILLQQNGRIHHLQYRVGPKITNFTSYQLHLTQEAKESQHVYAEKDCYYYVDNKQLIKFTIQNGSLEQYKILNFLQVNGQFKIFVRENMIYLINGNHGMIIYKLQNDVLYQLDKLVIEDFLYLFPNIINFNLVDYAITENYLYLLDSDNGVYRFNFKSMKIDGKFFIDQQSCRVISIRNNSIILIQQSPLFSEVLEGKIIENGWAIIRKKTITKQIIRNVYQYNNNYILLISNPINMIYQKNLIENITNPQLIQGNNIYQLELLGLSETDQDFVIGIYRYGVAIYLTQESQAQISCQASISQQNKVTIHLNSTNCLNKNQSDVFNYCQSKLQYVFDVHGVLMNPQQEDLYIYLCVAASSVLLGLFFSIVFLIRRYQLKKEKIDQIRKSRRTLSTLQ